MTALGTEGLALWADARLEDLRQRARVTAAERREAEAKYAPTPPSVPCPTSADAARGVEASGKAARDRATILAYLRSRPDGATEAEIAAATGLLNRRLTAPAPMPDPSWMA